MKHSSFYRIFIQCVCLLLFLPTVLAETAYRGAVGEWELSLRGSNTLRSLLGGSKQRSYQLSLCDDGTFCMQSTDSRPVHGHWKVLRNPYCLTDRHYHQVLLKTLPQVKEKHVVICQGSCRMRRNRLTHGTWVWKEDELGETNRWKHLRRRFLPRKVVASFSGRKTDDEASSVGWEDLEYFGY